eukprot:2271056-Alexandrium_andersonii.AAC.2
MQPEEAQDVEDICVDDKMAHLYNYPDYHAEHLSQHPGSGGLALDAQLDNKYLTWLTASRFPQSQAAQAAASASSASASTVPGCPLPNSVSVQVLHAGARVLGMRAWATTRTYPQQQGKAEGADAHERVCMRSDTDHQRHCITDAQMHA